MRQISYQADLGRKYSTFLSQLKTYETSLVFIVNCLRETCTFTRFVFFSQRPRWNRRGVDRCALLLASIVWGPQAGDPESRTGDRCWRALEVKKRAKMTSTF